VNPSPQPQTQEAWIVDQLLSVVRDVVPDLLRRLLRNRLDRLDAPFQPKGAIDEALRPRIFSPRCCGFRYRTALGWRER
jgi:hypothetical protein